MSRTTTTAVQELLQKDYRTGAPLQPFVDTATTIVDRVATLAVQKGYTLTPVELELIERWLAAHCYCQNDPIYMSKSTGGASGSFQRAGASDDFGSTDYGKMAVRLDYSGSLNAIGKRLFAGGFWVGKPPSEQVPYDQRS